MKLVNDGSLDCMKLVLVLAVELAACGSASTQGALDGKSPSGTDTGTLSGTVSFVGTPCPEPKGPPCDGVYPGYDVVVRTKDGKTVVGKVTSGVDGTFAIDLPAGAYVILTQAGLTEADQRRNEVTVSRDALAKVALQIDTGVR